MSEAGVGRGVLLDTGVLVLLVVGSLGPLYVSRHPRCQASGFDSQDFELLLGLVAGRSLGTTSHVLAETSNLLRLKIHGLLEAQVMEAFRLTTAALREVTVEGVLAVEVPEFRYLGLADAGIILAAGQFEEVLTTDAPLYDALARRAFPVRNFTHEREQMWRRR